MKELYFIAVVLPLYIRKEVYNFKKIMAERYYARHAFKCPTHITLHMPMMKSMQEAGFIDSPSILQRIRDHLK